ncbi:MAG TPA: DUF6084 family protein [Gemmatimonadaceae bacterium]|nr:DUF6084 family protein [Gemmatimonadaceae bacterium]
MSDLHFSIVGARAEPYAAVPTLLLRLRIEERTAQPIHFVALRCQVMIEAKRRRYSAEEEVRLVDLFGEPHRWGDTLRTMLWTHVPLIVGGFEGASEVDVPLLCTYDLEVASSRYFRSLEDGEIPLVLQFSGTVYSKGEAGFNVEQLSWTHEASYRLPVSVWRDVVDMYFPNTGWIRLRSDNLDALQEIKGRRGLTSWDEVISSLVASEAETVEPVEPL